MAKESREGRCYELAVKHVWEYEEGTVIHALVWSPNLKRMIGHALVETDTGYIYEPVTGFYWEKAELYREYKIKEIARYDLEQVSINCLKFKHFGPWHNEGGE